MKARVGNSILILLFFFYLIPAKASWSADSYKDHLKGLVVSAQISNTPSLQVGYFKWFDPYDAIDYDYGRYGPGKFYHVYLYPQIAAEVGYSRSEIVFFGVAPSFKLTPAHHPFYMAGVDLVANYSINNQYNLTIRPSLSLTLLGLFDVGASYNLTIAQTSEADFYQPFSLSLVVRPNMLWIFQHR